MPQSGSQPPSRHLHTDQELPIEEGRYFQHSGAQEFWDGDDLTTANQLSTADYAAQRDSILADEDDDVDEDEFVYPGAEPTDVTDYKRQMADVLEDADDELEFAANQGADNETEQSLNTELKDLSPVAPRISLPEASPSTTPERPVYSPRSRPFLHPSVSRLRSMTPRSQTPNISSAASVTSATSSNLRGGVSPSLSHFSSISRASSVSDLRSTTASHQSDVTENERGLKARDVFRWTQLKTIGDQIFPSTSQKASAILGSSWGAPTVMVSNGLVCVGTDRGVVVVYDFRQQFKCACGTIDEAKPTGGVTALALSYDHTFIAVGYSSGHINLYDLSKPQVPSRSVPPTSISAVLSGRKEGHILGAPVTQIGFVGTRHTAIVSSDDTGMAFYHSLGKVLFVEANDVLRLLGKYSALGHDESEAEPPATPSADDASETSTIRQSAFTSQPTLSLSGLLKKTRPPNTILALSSLPLGTNTHALDSYDLVAIITPVKLVIVGLRPTPRTWYRRHRVTGLSEGDLEQESEASRWQACLAWYPSSSSIGESEDITHAIKNGAAPAVGSAPVLAFSWGRIIRLMRAREDVVRQTIEDKKIGGGKKKTVNVGQAVFDDGQEWRLDEDVLALQWLNTTQLVALTPTHLNVYEVGTADVVEKIPFSAGSLTSLPGSVDDVISLRIAHSVRSYKGKLFALSRQDLRVGSLLSWADRILSHVEEGDFLSAIELTRAYYIGNAPGSKHGLPRDPASLRGLVGKKLYDLMVASAAYAFAEERMTDHTHVTPDGRGVDRTPLFEGLVDSCVQASIALNDFSFLYEDLYERYESSCITPIFLHHIEPWILDGSLREVPPYVAQRLIAMHGELGEYEKAERVIWHLDPANLDSNQAIKLCHKYELFDGLIFVYTRTLQDFVSPIVELLGLVRTIRQRAYSLAQATAPKDAGPADCTDTLIERLMPNAYKVYPYLSNILSGLTYPSEEPLPASQGSRARKEVYQFLFSGHSVFWPPGPSGRLIPTAESGDNGLEPTHPYLRLLLRFDAESFLHALDIAFEDPYLNDAPNGTSRQTIINILLKIIAPDNADLDLDQRDITLLRIFISRNVPKYPQFVEIAPSAKQTILLGLADDPDTSTTEDRQLAAEFLLSTFTPQNHDDLTERFGKAGFFRILRTWYKHDREWSALISTYVNDPDIRPEELFPNLDNVLDMAARWNKGTLPEDVTSTAVAILPQLVTSSAASAALFVDRHMPHEHFTALRLLGPDESFKQFMYLRSLFEPGSADVDSENVVRSPYRPFANNLAPALRGRYLQLTCQYNPGNLLPLIQKHAKNYFDPEEAIEIARTSGLDDVVVWVMDRAGRPEEAFQTLDAAAKRLSAELAEELLAGGPEAQSILEHARSLFTMGVKLCQQHAVVPPGENISGEDLWFSLLRSQIEAVQSFASALPNAASDELSGVPASQSTTTLASLRQLLQETFSAFISQSSSREHSFPRLFKRLVDSTAASRSSAKGFYTEFRLILTGMLESYRFDGDFLTLNNRLVKQDLYDTLVESLRSRSRGWRPKVLACPGCKQPFQTASAYDARRSEDESQKYRITAFRSGLLYHTTCVP